MNHNGQTPDKKTWYVYRFDDTTSGAPVPNNLDSATNNDLVLVDDDEDRWRTYDSGDNQNLVLMDDTTDALILAKLSKRQCASSKKVWDDARRFFPTEVAMKEFMTHDTVDGMMCGFRYQTKNPLKDDDDDDDDPQPGMYSSSNVHPDTANLVSQFVVRFCEEVYKAAKPMGRCLPEFKWFSKAVGHWKKQSAGGTPVFHQFRVGFEEYWSHAQTNDSAFFYTLLGGLHADGNTDQILYYLVFPEYGVKVPLRHGDLMFLDPRQYHCCTNPSDPNKNMIFSAYNTKNSVDTEHDV